MTRFLIGLIRDFQRLVSLTQSSNYRSFNSKTGPLIGPSANLSGKASGRVFDHIMQDFDFQVFGYADDPFLTGKDSTILDLSGERAVILRQGAITKEELLANVPELRFKRGAAWNVETIK